jgi:aminoglycoside 6-adenylyltransferase
VLSKIQQWAKTQPNIKVVLLTSSQTHENTKIDQLSDYDIELYVTDPKPYIENSDWLQNFGEVLISLPEKRNLLGTDQPTRLVIHKDGTKVDFTLADIHILAQIINLPSLPDWLDDGYKVLLDKNNVTRKLKKATHKAYIPKKPSEKQYRELVTEFWWETTYVAKNLRREEILPAKYSSDFVIKYKILLKMLEWYVQINRGWSCRTGFVGKGIIKLLRKTEWAELKGIFSGVDIEQNWQALFNTIKFFRKISIEVATNLGYKYLYELDENVSQYLKSIWENRK